jgi:hypothetical protein
MDTRGQSWAPLTGRRSYRVRLTLPRLPVSQGEFRLYAFLGDETALHLHDQRILRPGFRVASREYVVGLVRPEHTWSLPEPAEAAPTAEMGARAAAR